MTAASSSTDTEDSFNEVNLVIKFVAVNSGVTGPIERARERGCQGDCLFRCSVCCCSGCWETWDNWPC